MARYLTIEDGREYLWDFDENRILLVTYGDTENIKQVEFSTDDTEGPTTWTSEVMTNPTTGNKYVQVPNEFLNGEYSRLVCYVIAEDETGQHTRTKEIFRIKKRQQPEDYEITFTDRVYIRDLKAIAERYRDQAKEYSEQAAASSTQAGQYNTQALASKNAAELSAQQANQSMTLSKQYSEASAESASQSAATFNAIKEYVGSESAPSSALGQIYTAKENAKQEVTEHAESTKKDVIDPYVENTTKPAIDAFTEAQKKELDTYEKSKESELDTYTESQKAELNSHTASMKSQLDGYTTAKEQDISDYTEQKKAEVGAVYQDDLNDINNRIGPFDFRETAPQKITPFIDYPATVDEMETEATSVKALTVDMDREPSDLLVITPNVDTEPSDAIALTLEPDIPTADSHKFGIRGQICIDDNYLYVCVSDNMWKKIPLLDL